MEPLKLSLPEKRFARNDASHAVQKPSPTVFDAPRCADVTSAEEKERRERERFERDEATIKYEQCRTGVYKPSGFNDQDFIKSEPGSFLSIDHIHGYHTSLQHHGTKCLHEKVSVPGQLSKVWFTADLTRAYCALYTRPSA